MSCRLGQKNINLLPVEYRKHFVRERWMRLIAFELMLLSTIAIAGSVLLVPSIFLARALTNTSAVERDVAERGLDIGIEVEGLPSLRFIRQELSFLSRYQGQVQPSVYIRAASDVAGVGVRVSSVSYRSDESKTIVVSGVADRRNDLIAYQHALGESVFFEEPEIPVSVLAKSTELVFSLTIPIRPNDTP